MNEYELISLEQATKILRRYDICFVMPKGMTGFTKYGVNIERFDDCFFTSISSYNKLMLNTSFYERFTEYEYMLIYQLDAFVFKDKLEFFCELNYDYIGAPWLYGEIFKVDEMIQAFYVGNGGLSLRKIQSCINILKESKIDFNTYMQNEDVFFSTLASETFSIAPIDVALQFSFETQVKKCFERNHYKLPFGCHGLLRYDYEFWKSYLENYGYKLVDNDIYEEKLDVKYEDTYYSLRKKQCLYLKFGFNELLNDLLLKYNGEMVVWGAGAWGHKICKMMTEQQVKVNCIIDSNNLLYGSEVENIEVVSYDTYKCQYPSSNIVIAVNERSCEIADILEKDGYVYKYDFIFAKDIFEIMKDLISI